MDTAVEWMTGAFAVASGAFGILFLGGSLFLRHRGERTDAVAFGFLRGCIYLVEATFFVWLLVGGRRNSGATVGAAFVVFVGGQALLKWCARRLDKDSQTGAEGRG